MSTPHDPVDHSGARPYWPVPIIRALPLLVVGFVVTFLADHSPLVGLIALAVLTLGSGLAVAILSTRIADASTRRLHLASGAVASVIGVGSAIAAGVGAGFGTMVLLATVFALLTGALELFSGVRTRTTQMGRDWLAVGIGTVVFALVLLVVPGDSVFVVGLIGAYGAVAGVYLVIAGLSLKWARPALDVDTAAEAAR